MKDVKFSANFILSAFSQNVNFYCSCQQSQYLKTKTYNAFNAFVTSYYILCLRGGVTIQKIKHALISFHSNKSCSAKKRSVTCFCFVYFSFEIKAACYYYKIKKSSVKTPKNKACPQ